MRFFFLCMLLCITCSKSTTPVKIVSYSKALINNARYGRNIGTISDKYSVKATPSDKTFGIWGTIYGRLFLYNFVWPWTNDLFTQSMDLNGQWVKEWNDEDIVKANKTLHELIETNRNLVREYAKGKNYTYSCLHSYTHKTLDIYTTWVTLASILNDWIVRVYINGEEDNSKEDVIQKLETFENKNCKGVEYTIDRFKKGINI